MEITTKGPEETKSLGREIANKLVNSSKPSNKGGALVVALSGELGSGKTTFTQGFAEGLGITNRILSPTFILMRSYELGAGGKRFYHIDLYRLETGIKGEMANLGVFDIFTDPQNTILIEWAEKAKNFLPKDTIWIEFVRIDENKRKIKVADR